VLVAGGEVLVAVGTAVAVAVGVPAGFITKGKKLLTSVTSPLNAVGDPSPTIKVNTIKIHPNRIS
jgi:ABC-type nitrate/sulfonate/bicarbonate transport system permease component